MLIRSVVFGALLALVAASAGAQDYKASLKGPAAGAVARTIEATRIECFVSGKETKCPLADFVAGASIFYGRMPGDPAEHAVAFVTHESATGGNAVYQMAFVFKSGADGFVLLGRADETIGMEPRDVRFERGAISYTGTILGPRDPRCCPTGKARFKLIVANDRVIFVDPKKGHASETGGAAVARSKAAEWLIREQIAEACDGKTGRIDPAAAIERDLTGDGKADLIISHDGITCTATGRSTLCGMQVCSVMVYVRDGALLKPVVDDLLGMKVTVSDGSVPTIAWLAAGGAPRSMKWNGTAFR